jgi:hypothetical protein
MNGLMKTKLIKDRFQLLSLMGQRLDFNFTGVTRSEGFLLYVFLILLKIYFNFYMDMTDLTIKFSSIIITEFY